MSIASRKLVEYLPKDRKEGDICHDPTTGRVAGGDVDTYIPVTLTTDSKPTISSFTSTGATTWEAPATDGTMDVLLVGGGGGGGSRYGGGGGGGGIVEFTAPYIGGSSLPVVVGGGGAGGSAGAGSDANVGANGGNTTIDVIGEGGIEEIIDDTATTITSDTKIGTVNGDTGAYVLEWVHNVTASGADRHILSLLSNESAHSSSFVLTIGLDSSNRVTFHQLGESVVRDNSPTFGSDVTYKVVVGTDGTFTVYANNIEIGSTSVSLISNNDNLYVYCCGDWVTAATGTVKNVRYAQLESKIAYGGGGGGHSGSLSNGADGSSGGGGGSSAASLGGEGIIGQGYNGAITSILDLPDYRISGGGGGAGGDATVGTTGGGIGTGSHGGIGKASLFTGSEVYYGGGGAGGISLTATGEIGFTYGLGGQGGGGDCPSTLSVGNDGDANTGGGGSGGYKTAAGVGQDGGSGGSGVAYVRVSLPQHTIGIEISSTANHWTTGKITVAMPQNATYNTPQELYDAVNKCIVADYAVPMFQNTGGTPLHDITGHCMPALPVFYPSTENKQHTMCRPYYYLDNRIPSDSFTGSSAGNTESFVCFYSVWPGDSTVGRVLTLDSKYERTRMTFDELLEAVRATIQADMDTVYGSEDAGTVYLFKEDEGGSTRIKFRHTTIHTFTKHEFAIFANYDPLGDAGSLGKYLGLRSYADTAAQMIAATAADNSNRGVTDSSLVREHWPLAGFYPDESDYQFALLQANNGQPPTELETALGYRNLPLNVTYAATNTIAIDEKGRTMDENTFGTVQGTHGRYDITFTVNYSNSGTHELLNTTEALTNTSSDRICTIYLDSANNRLVYRECREAKSILRTIGSATYGVDVKIRIVRTEDEFLCYENDVFQGSLTGLSSPVVFNTVYLFHSRNDVTTLTGTMKNLTYTAYIPTTARRYDAVETKVEEVKTVYTVADAKGIPIDNVDLLQTIPIPHSDYEIELTINHPSQSPLPHSNNHMFVVCTDFNNIFSTRKVVLGAIKNSDEYSLWLEGTQKESSTLVLNTDVTFKIVKSGTNGYWYRDDVLVDTWTGLSETTYDTLYIVHSWNVDNCIDGTMTNATYTTKRVEVTIDTDSVGFQSSVRAGFYGDNYTQGAEGVQGNPGNPGLTYEGQYAVAGKGYPRYLITENGPGFEVAIYRFGTYHTTVSVNLPVDASYADAAAFTVAWNTAAFNAFVTAFQPTYMMNLGATEEPYQTYPIMELTTTGENKHKHTLRWTNTRVWNRMAIEDEVQVIAAPTEMWPCVQRDVKDNNYIAAGFMPTSTYFDVSFVWHDGEDSPHSGRILQIMSGTDQKSPVYFYNDTLTFSVGSEMSNPNDYTVNWTDPTLANSLGWSLPKSSVTFPITFRMTVTVEDDGSTPTSTLWANGVVVTNKIVLGTGRQEWPSGDDMHFFAGVAEVTIPLATANGYVSDIKLVSLRVNNDIGFSLVNPNAMTDNEPDVAILTGFTGQPTSAPASPQVADTTESLTADDQVFGSQHMY